MVKVLSFLLCVLGVGFGLVSMGEPTVHAQDGRVSEGTSTAASLGFGIDSGGSILTQAAAISRFRQSGAAWTRAAVYWSNAEPLDVFPANFNWTSADSDLAPLISAGIRPVVYVTRNPLWASITDCGPIDTSNAAMIADFEEFMTALATRYPQVPVWVMYNEADNALPPLGEDGCFGNILPNGSSADTNLNGVPDVNDYAEMARAARRAVRQVNPNIRVAFSVALDNFNTITCPPGYPGGCPPGSTFNSRFVPDLFAYMSAHPLPQGEAYADLIAFHYYDIYGPYWQTRVGSGFRGVQAKAQYIRTLLQDKGLAMDIFITETGVDSKRFGNDGQSQCLVTHMVRSIAANLHGVGWWTLSDLPAQNWYYGLLDVNLNPKPSYTAFRTFTAQMNGQTYARTVNSKSFEQYEFTGGAKKKYVVWSSVLNTSAAAPCADTHTPQKLKIKKVKKVRVTDMYGTSTLIKDNKKGDLDKKRKVMKILLGSAPTYVELNP